MELEKLEVLLEINTQRVAESINRVMPQIDGLLKRIEQATGRSGKSVENNLDMSGTTKKVENTLNDFVSNFSKQMDRMENIAKEKSVATSRQLETGFKRTRTQAGKEIDLMVKDINAKLGQAKAAQGRIAELTARRSAAVKDNDTGQVVKYDSQIAQAESQMTSYRNKATAMARTMKAEFDAVPSSLSRISETMDLNEGKIETMRAKIANMQKMYETQRKTVGSYQDGFGKTDSPESLGTMQKIQKETAQMNKLIHSNDALQQAYATTEDRAKVLRGALEQLNGTLNKSSIQTGNASLGMKNVANMSDEAKSVWSRFGGLFNRTTNNIAHGAKSIGSTMAGFFSMFNRSSNRTNRSLLQGNGSLNKFAGGWKKTMWMLANQLIVFTLLYRGVMALGQGLWSSLKTNEELASSLNQIKVNLLTAFYPIYQAVLPALNALMSAVARVTGYIASFVATLFGTTYAAAKQGAQGLYENVKALEDTGSGADKAKDKIKELQNSLMGFDEINRIGLVDVNADDKDKGSDDGINFGTPDYSTPAWLNKFAEDAKNVLSQIFQPVKAAWDKYGKSVLDSFKYMLSEIWELTKSVGRAFLEVWTDGTGERILGNILQLVASIFNSVGNLARGFREAWETNNLGVKIFSSILGIVEDLTGHLRDMGKATEEWTRSLDFTPLLTSIDKILKAFRPVADNIGGGLAWLYENVLLPIAKWTIEDVLPAFLDVLSGALKVLNEIIEALKPTFKWLWEEFLKPMAEWSGGVVVSVLEKIADGLNGIGDFISQHQSGFSNFVLAFVVFAGTLKIISGLSTLISILSGVFGALSSIGGLSGVIGLLGGSIKGVITILGGPWAVAIGAAVAVGVLLWKNWDTVKEKASQLGGWISEKWDGIKKKTSETWDNVSKWVKDKSEESRKKGSENAEKLRIATVNAWDTIKKKTSDNWTNVSTAVRDKAESARKWGSDKLTNLKNVVSTQWNALKNDTTNRWQDIASKISTKASEARTNATNAFQNIGKKASEYGGNVRTAMGGAFDTVAGWAKNFGTNVANGLLGGIGAIKSAAASIGNGLQGVIKSAVNGVIGGINWVLERVGTKTRIATWKPAAIKAYAQGTGYHPGGPALVNDAPGQHYQEAYEVNGKVGLFPKVRNMFVDLPRGAKVLDGKRTAKMYGGSIPQYAGGIGNWLGKAWNGAKEMAGTVWDYVSNPSKLLDIAISKFVNLSGAFEPALSIAKGGIGTIAKEATNYVKGFLNQGPADSGYGKVNFNGLVRTSGFGYRTHPITGKRHLHAGVDYGGGMGIGHPIHAQTSGTVKSAGPAGGGYGNWVNIKNGVYDYIYAHLSKALVGRGAAVETGQKIGLMGNTGNSTGPHVHYEVRKNGSPIDPDAYHATMSKNSGSPAGQGVERWRSTIVRALSMNGLPASEAYVSAWLRQIRTESGGNEKAVQSPSVVDVNTLAGNPARGLLQTIPQTFNAYKFAGYDNIYNGLHNALAAINYAKNRYGRTGMLSVIGNGHGYENGGLVTRDSYRVGEGNKKELIIPLEKRNRALELLDLAKSYLGVDDYSTTLQMPDVMLSKPIGRFESTHSNHDISGGGLSGMSSSIELLLRGLIGNNKQSGGNLEVTLEIDRSKLGKAVIKEINEVIDKTGKVPLDI